MASMAVVLVKVGGVRLGEVSEFSDGLIGWMLWRGCGGHCVLRGWVLGGFTADKLSVWCRGKRAGGRGGAGGFVWGCLGIWTDGVGCLGWQRCSLCLPFVMRPLHLQSRQGLVRSENQSEPLTASASDIQVWTR